MAEWLRRLIRNQLGVVRGSSNLSAVDFFSAEWWDLGEEQNDKGHDQFLTQTKKNHKKQKQFNNFLG